MTGALKVPHAQCVYIADNAKKDFVAPNALGWTTIQIVRSDGVYRDAAPAQGGTPRHAAESLDEIDDIIAQEP